MANRSVSSHNLFHRCKLNDFAGQLPRAERIKAFKKRRQSGAGGRKMAENRGILLLSLEEMVALFGDIVEGLAFLVSGRSLDLL